MRWLLGTEIRIWVLDIGGARLTAGPGRAYARSVEDGPRAPRPAVGSGRHEDLLGGARPTLASRLDAWIADARVDQSADERSRERWLTTAADADATFSGVLLELAERGAAVTVATVAGRRVHGTVSVLGCDFASIRRRDADEVLVSLGAVTSLRTSPGVVPAVGERVVTTDLRLGDVLAELLADRVRVHLVVGDGRDPVSGTLRSVGQDLVTVRGDGPDQGLSYVPLRAVVELVLG